MKLILYSDHEHNINDLHYALKQRCEAVIIFNRSMADYETDPAFDLAMKQLIEKETPDVFFSIYYYPLISNVCLRYHLPYVSWVFDSPSLSTYSKTVCNPCNYVFLFDRQNYYELKNQGIQTVYHLPLSTNADRLGSVKMSPEDRTKYECDLSLMANMYTDNLYSKIKYLPPYVKGYFSAILEAQMNIYGYHFLRDALTDTIVNEFKTYVKYNMQENYLMDDRQMIIDVFLADQLAFLERVKLINHLSGHFHLTLYTKKHNCAFENVYEGGFLDYNTDMPKAFKGSKINLNTTKRSIQTGIPLRLLDIMGSGGFVISNYQEELLDHFEPDKDLVIYEDLKDLTEKIRYYLAHEDERKEIARRGYEKVKKYYNYDIALDTIFHIVFDTKKKKGRITT